MKWEMEEQSKNKSKSKNVTMLLLTVKRHKIWKVKKWKGQNLLFVTQLNIVWIQVRIWNRNWNFSKVVTGKNSFGSATLIKKIQQFCRMLVKETTVMVPSSALALAFPACLCSTSTTQRYTKITPRPSSLYMLRKDILTVWRDYCHARDS